MVSLSIISLYVPATVTYSYHFVSKGLDLYLVITKFQKLITFAFVILRLYDKIMAAFTNDSIRTIYFRLSS